MRSKLSLSDEWETPNELYDFWCRRYNIHPEVDVAANNSNTKSKYFCIDGLLDDWYMDSWCNPPHSKTKEFVLKASEQWRKHNIDIIMLIPVNSICSKYFESVWHEVEIYPIFGRIIFLRDGKPSKYPSRNAYCIVIWRKKK